MVPLKATGGFLAVGMAVAELAVDRSARDVFLLQLLLNRHLGILLSWHCFVQQGSKATLE